MVHPADRNPGTKNARLENAGLIGERSTQRTDATHVLATVPRDLPQLWLIPRQCGPRWKNSPAPHHTCWPALWTRSGDPPTAAPSPFRRTPHPTQDQDPRRWQQRLFRLLETLHQKGGRNSRPPGPGKNSSRRFGLTHAHSAAACVYAQVPHRGLSHGAAPGRGRAGGGVRGIRAGRRAGRGEGSVARDPRVARDTGAPGQRGLGRASCGLWDGQPPEVGRSPRRLSRSSATRGWAPLTAEAIPCGTRSPWRPATRTHPCPAPGSHLA